MARVAVGADRSFRIIGELLAASFLGDLFAVLPVAAEPAIGGLADCREILLLDPRGDILRDRLAGVLAAHALRFILIESIERRLTRRLERRLHHFCCFCVQFGVGRRHRASAEERAAKSNRNEAANRHAVQRLIAGASNGAPFAFRARNVVNAIAASELNTSSGNRCWRKQSYSRHSKLRSSPCDTRYAGHVV